MSPAAVNICVTHKVHGRTLEQGEPRILAQFHIAKTRLYNFDPLKPQFYIVKLGFRGVYIIFLFLLKTQIVGTR